MKRFLQIISIGFLFSCVHTPETAQEIVDKAIATHGCESYTQQKVTFDFRQHSYSVDRTSESYIYTRLRQDSLGITIDSLFNSSLLKRYVNDTLVSLTEEWQTKYASSVNSVLYFFQLPCLLNDPAVMKKMEGKTTIEGKEYYQIEVKFKASGGGEDFQDVYMYWFNTENYQLDYLAYNYQVEGGGTRFRKAIHQRNLDGLIIQDYINMKAKETFPPLKNLPTLYEKGQLEELSRIINENVKIN